MLRASGKESHSLFPSRIRRVTSTRIFHLLFMSAIIVLVFLRPPAVFSGDTDTARNYLNTIISSLSTILALCISIILVAIQLTASNYTHRVLDFFVRLPFNVSLFLIFLVTIMHSFFLMAKIRDPLRDPLPVALRPEMSADLVLVMICFLSLLFYMYAVVQLLKPDRIIDLIVREHDVAFLAGRYANALDNVEQICDIAKRAASFSDSVTGSRCLKVMLDIACKLPLPQSVDDPLFPIHRTIVDQWIEIVGVAVKERETGMLTGALMALYQQGDAYIRQGGWSSAELVVRAYKQLSFSHLLAEGQLLHTEQVADHLYRLASNALTQEMRGELFCLRTWQVTQAIGEAAFTWYPSIGNSLVAGFLLSEYIPTTLIHRMHAVRSDELLDLYFGLWKAFARNGRLADVARWAKWWEQAVTTDRIMRMGQILATALAQHLERNDIWQTLGYAWAVNPGQLVKERMADRTNSRDALFDYWPVV